MRSRLACLGHQIGGDVEDPVDVDRGAHIRLDLGDDAGDRQGDHIAGPFTIELNIGNGLGAQVHAGRADRRAGGVVSAAAHACTKRRHHHVDIAEADRRSGKKPTGLRRLRCQWVADLAAVDDFGQEPASMVKAERVDHDCIILARSEIAEGETRLRWIGCPHACEVEIEPVLAVQRRLRPIEKIRREAVHMGKLRALLASVEPGACCLEAGTVLRSAGERRYCRRGARIEPQPGVGDRPIAAADEPGAVALSGDGDSCGAGCKIRDFFAEATQRAGAIEPGLIQRLRCRAIVSGGVSIAHGGSGDLAAGQIEGDSLDDRGAGIYPNDNLLGRCHCRPISPPPQAPRQAIRASNSSEILPIPNSLR